MAMPSFNHPSWNDGWWNLWGLMYFGREYTGMIQSLIVLTFDESKAALKKLGPQSGPMGKRVAEWHTALKSFARPIAFGEAEGVYGALVKLRFDITSQAATDLSVGNEPEPQPDAEEVESPIDPVVDIDEDEPDEADDEETTAAPAAPKKKRKKKNKNGTGHGKSTAESRPADVKPKKSSWTPPTPQQEWVSRQRDMATACDNGIGFGAHPVNQDSVKRYLDLDVGDGGVNQYRGGPENGHTRIMKSASGRTFYTCGLTHQDRRDQGNFFVYERQGASNRFTHIAGRRHPAHPPG